jgi:23S rRNA (pseudouridine1915-N3)-methyltransferase
VKIYVAAVSPSRSRSKSSPAGALTDDFVSRASHYVACESVFHPSEAALITWLDRQAGRTAPALILMDSGGKQLSSEEFAAHLGGLRDSGTQVVVLAIGPADGWSAAAGARASLTMSLGRITLPHELARAVVAEQVYRALTILAGHPYHSGH